MQQITYRTLVMPTMTMNELASLISKEIQQRQFLHAVWHIGDRTFVTLGRVEKGGKMSINQMDAKRMREIGKVIERELPAGYGFCLHTFPMNDKGGRIDYISNANREDMIEVFADVGSG